MRRKVNRISIAIQAANPFHRVGEDLTAVIGAAIAEDVEAGQVVAEDADVDATGVADVAGTEDMVAGAEGTRSAPH